ncbi:MAG TPA: vWA domain-containing protein [Tepidisphaeraceae bacterium]|nr:vWA domain-containing protein [Tepidisphaeraceae bacterium]
MTLQSPILFTTSLVMVLAVAVNVWRVRIIPEPTKFLMILGTLMIALASGGLTVRLPQQRNVVVMVDLSPSTRTAQYRDTSELQKRIGQLLGDVPYRVETFADSAQIEKTVFAPPQSDAVVLFSDGQFDLPKVNSPIYVALDSNLEHPTDAAVTRLEQHGDSVAITIHNMGNPRHLKLIGAHGPATAPSGQTVLNATVDSNAQDIAAQLSPDDAWPENDALSLKVQSPAIGERWWISQSSAPANYRLMKPTELPTDPAPYVSAGLIVLNNIRADLLLPIQQQRLTQYVHDLGGGLMIVGGDQSFVAGGYIGTALDALSPLASAPPQPQRIWIVLVDSSGSMSAPVEGQTRLQRASNAAVQLLHRLPPNDVVHIGSFARNVRWWSNGKSAEATAKLSLPPADLNASGPTNLQEALESIAAQLKGEAAAEIILLTDADARFDNPLSLAVALRNVRARVNLMSTADASRSDLMRVVVLTVGSHTTQLDPKLWELQTTRLAQSIIPSGIEQLPANVTFSGLPSSLPPRIVPMWNRTWIKPQATELASAQETSNRTSVAATWNVGAGQVSSIAFSPTVDEIAAMAQAAARAARDPKFVVTSSADAELVVTVDAHDEQQYLNDLDITLTLLSDADSNKPATVLKVPQTGPGKYEVSLPAPRATALGVVRNKDQIIGRFSVAGRYAQEYEFIGNNRAAMQQLTGLSGGAVIEPSQTSPIQFNWPQEDVSLASLLATLGAGAIASGLIAWKRSN